MKIKILIIVFVSIFVGSNINLAIKKVEKKHNRQLIEEIYSEILNKDTSKESIRIQMKKLLSDPEFDDKAKLFNKKKKQFRYSMVAVKYSLYLLISYIAALLIMKTTHNQQLKQAVTPARDAASGAP